ncbi:MAG: ankyrin repeat domain-containing protein [Pseudomonadota bacterium]
MSEVIVKGTDADVLSGIHAGMSINTIDIYGTTPLITAILAKKPQLVAALLEAGADVSFCDASGSSPLFWAVENNQFKAAQLLLERKANPNDYTRTSQPVMAYALLRRAEPFIDLLVKHGGDTQFAQDFIDAKLLGHRYELDDSVDIYSPADNQFIELDYEGFYLEFTLGFIQESLEKFFNGCRDSKFQPIRPQVNIAIEALKRASALRNYRGRYVNRNFHQKEIDSLMGVEPLIIPVSYEGHAITFVKNGVYFTHCDRGAHSKVAGSVIIYRMKRPENLDKTLLNNLMFEAQNSTFLHLKLFSTLGLEAVESIPTESQIAGNCSWANVEASIAAVMFMLLAKDFQASPDKLKAIREEVLWFYQAWIEWDKDRALDECIQAFQDANNKARQASRAAMLGRILFQRCSSTSTKDIQRAKKILAVLMIPEIQYVLKSYIQAYLGEGKVKTDPGTNLKKLLKVCGIDYRDFLN